jgi:hypothetical protein
LNAELQLWEGSYPATVAIKRAYQPTQQRTPAGLFAYVFQINNKRYGWQSSSDEYNETDKLMVHTEKYIIEKTLQISAQSITEIDAEYTAGDVAESLAAHINSSAIIERFELLKIGILRVTNVRHPHFINDRDRYEGDPSFDFVITYRQEIETTGTSVDNINGEVYSECSLPPP